MDWECDRCLQLIAEYKKYPTLWDPKHPSHYRKEKKLECWDKVAVAVRCSIDDAKKKMASLLASYRREKAKMKGCMRTSKDKRIVYVTRWYAFKPLSFLLRVKSKPRPSLSQLAQPPATREVVLDEELERALEEEYALNSQYYDDTSRSNDLDLQDNAVILQENDDNSHEYVIKQANDVISEENDVNSEETDVVSEENDVISEDNDDNSQELVNLEEDADNPPGNSVNLQESAVNLDDYDVNIKFCQNLAKHKPSSNPTMQIKQKKFELTEDPNVKDTEPSEIQRSQLIDECSVYGQHVANKLKSYSKKTKNIAQHQINMILFSADMGHYDKIENHFPSHSNSLS